MNVYLIAGKAGSGKNYVANLLKEQLPDSVITGLSKYIKLFALELGEWDGNDDNKPRSFLQQTGDKLRAVDKNILSKRMLEDIIVYESLGIKNVIISDARLEDEMNYLKNSNNHTVIIKVNSTNYNRILTSEEKEHQTETELDCYDKYDYIIENNENIKEQVNEILKGR